MVTLSNAGKEMYRGQKQTSMRTVPTRLQRTPCRGKTALPSSRVSVTGVSLFFAIIEQKQTNKQAFVSVLAAVLGVAESSTRITAEGVEKYQSAFGSSLLA